MVKRNPDGPRHRTTRGTAKTIKGCLTGVGALYVVTGSVAVTVVGTVAALTAAALDRVRR